MLPSLEQEADSLTYDAVEPDRGTREQAVERLEDLSFEGDGIAGRAETHTAGHYPIREFARGRAGPA